MSGRQSAPDNAQDAQAPTTVPTDTESPVTMPDGSNMTFESDWAQVAAESDDSPGAPSVLSSGWKKTQWKSYQNPLTKPDSEAQDANVAVCRSYVQQQIRGDTTGSPTFAPSGTRAASTETPSAREQPSEPGSARNS